MYYIAIFDVSPGWADLTSLISYLFFAVAGLLLGIVTEVVLWFKGRRKDEKEISK
jgi:FtsH-binding integral membrane protein